MKKITCVLFVLLLLMNVVLIDGKVYANSNNGVNVVVDGNKINFDEVQPFIDSNNRTLVPVRFVSESLGAKVDWNQSLKEVTISKNQKVIKLAIGDNAVNVDGEEVKLDTEAILRENRTFVPVAFISETLDSNVNWNDDTRTVEITSKDVEVDTQEVESDNEFIEPKINVIWNDGTSYDYYFYLELENYEEYINVEDTYKFKSVCISHEKLNSRYYCDIWGNGEWEKLDLTNWRDIDSDTMRVINIAHYLKPSIEEESRYRVSVGDVIKFEVKIKNETTGESKIYKKEVKFKKVKLRE